MIRKLIHLLIWIQDCVTEPWFGTKSTIDRFFYRLESRLTVWAIDHGRYP